MYDLFFNIRCDFRKVFSTQEFHVLMIEKAKGVLAYTFYATGLFLYLPKTSHYFLRSRYTVTLVKMSGLQDKIDNIEETLKSYEAEMPVIVEKGIDIDNILINEQFIDEKYNESLKNELLNNIMSCISDQLKALVRTQISEFDQN